MPNIATLSATFQISIPQAMVEGQGWCVGQELALIPKRQGVLIMPVPARDELRGLAKGANPIGYRDRSDRA